jgi:anti-sigma factor RsiW
LSAGLADSVAPHADDADLIRLGDGECSDQERGQIERHVAICQACARRREALRRLGVAVTAALAAADVGEHSSAPPAARPRRARAWARHQAALRAAVVLLAIGAVTASAQPVRGWLAARWEDLRVLVAPRAPVRAGSQEAAAVRFVPATSVFTIELVARQPAGVLTIAVAADTIATATVTPGSGREELIVRPAGLRIVNEPDAVASYDVRLPEGVSEVWVRIADQPARHLVPAPGAQWTIDLKTTRAVPR